MKCPDIGVLQAYIDGELDISERKSIEGHLQGCERCSRVYNELKANDDFAFGAISNYSRQIQERPVSVPETFERSQQGTKTIERKGEIYFMYKYRKAISAACAVAAIVTCLAVQPVRATIYNALSIFRVENVKGLNISVGDMQKIRSQLESHQGEIDMDKMGKIKTTGGERKNISAEELKAISDIKVLYPAEFSGMQPNASTTEPGTMDFMLDVVNVNGALKALGAEKLLPQGVDGKTFSVKVARTISMNYKVGSKSFNISQMNTPEIVVPEGVDADEIYNSMVELPIIPADLKKQLKSIKDWKNTLYVPVIENDSQEVDINGVKGVMQHRESPDGKYVNSMVIWGANGSIYSVQGDVSAEEVLKVARSMR